MPIRTLIVDDEYLALNLLEEFIRPLPDLEIVAKCKSPIQALDILQKGDIDLLFLDIQMPMLSGTNLLRSLPKPPVTIFTTAYSDHAVEAFNLNAVDYLLKPYAFERFLQALNKAKEHLKSRQEATPATPTAPTNSASGRDFMSARVDGKIEKIPYADILYIEGLKEYVKIVCPQRSYVILESMKNLEETLPIGQFLRVHKSYIVATAKVTSLDGNQLEIGKVKIPVSREKRDDVVQHIFF